MTPSTLSRIFSAVLATASFSVLNAASPKSLDLNERGAISLETDTIGTLGIVTDVNETSQGSWKAVPPVGSVEPQTGTQLTRKLTYKFPDEPVEMTTQAKIEGSKVVVEANWNAQSSAPGFARVDLAIPEELANDLTIELRDKPFMVNMDKGRNFKNEGDFVFRRTSTGEFLFRLTGEFPEIQFWFRESAREDGLRIRIFNVPNANTSTIGDATTLKWTLSFKEH
jgi:hypothetical protein